MLLNGGYEAFSVGAFSRLGEIKTGEDVHLFGGGVEPFGAIGCFWEGSGLADT